MLARFHLPNSVVHVFMYELCFILMVLLCSESPALCRASHSLHVQRQAMVVCLRAAIGLRVCWNVRYPYVDK